MLTVESDASGAELKAVVSEKHLYRAANVFQIKVVIFGEIWPLTCVDLSYCIFFFTFIQSLQDLFIFCPSYFL